MIRRLASGARPALLLLFFISVNSILLVTAKNQLLNSLRNDRTARTAGPQDSLRTKLNFLRAALLRLKCVHADVPPASDYSSKYSDRSCCTELSGGGHCTSSSV